MGIKSLTDLNGICNSRKCGIYKQWIYRKDEFMRVCDYMQKINYTIQDLNNVLTELKEFDRKNVVYTIVLIDWIREATDKIFKAINPTVVSGFKYNNDEFFKGAEKFFIAIRSFIVAHPLSTTRHKDYGLDGNYVCIDIRDNPGLLGFKGENFYFSLDLTGLKEGCCKNSDFYLFCYSDKDDNMKYFRIISCKFIDIFKVAETYIDRLYKLNKYLSRLKKRDYINN